MQYGFFHLPGEKMRNLIPFLTVLLLIWGISCSGGAPKTENSDPWVSALNSYRAEDFPAKFSEVRWRVLKFESTISVRLNSDDTSSDDESNLITQAREICLKTWDEKMKGQTAPLINILVYKSNGLSRVDKGGVGHVAAIVLNLPVDKICYVNFSAAWCEKGKETDKAIEEVKSVAGDSVYFEMYDTDMDPAFTALIGVTEIPSQLIFDQTGNQVGFYNGPLTKDEILEKLNPLLNRNTAD
jgi:thiol-disulfide isomerase/thioredoxin